MLSSRFNVANISLNPPKIVANSPWSIWVQCEVIKFSGYFLKVKQIKFCQRPSLTQTGWGKWFLTSVEDAWGLISYHVQSQAFWKETRWGFQFCVFSFSLLFLVCSRKIPLPNVAIQRGGRTAARMGKSLSWKILCLEFERYPRKEILLVLAR